MVVDKKHEITVNTMQACILLKLDSLQFNRISMKDMEEHLQIGSNLAKRLLEPLLDYIVKSDGK